MNLQDKILYQRKKNGLSQEALAEKIGVSRQAVSKWETGDAIPEINKLLHLAKVFGVTVDWLLSESEPVEEKTEALARTDLDKNTSRIDSMLDYIGKLFRRFGWLIGVYIAIGGLGFTIIGLLTRIITNSMFQNDDDVWLDEFGNIISGPDEMVSSLITNNPVATMGTALLGVGILLIITGIIVAIVLKKRQNQNS